MDEYEKIKKHTERYRKIKKLMKKVFGHENFKPNQYLIINRIIKGYDVCAVLPTGYGKSLTFQLPALYLGKTAIIVCPLISLMEDQQIILEKLGLKSICFNSNLRDKNQVKSDILKGEYQFVYITPESIIQCESFLKQLEDTIGISLVAIDEAHCISSYGYDFRPSYRNLTFLKESLPNVPIIALTATATPIVATDICEVLKLETKTGVIQSSFDRENLYIEVNKKKDMKKDLLPLVKKYMTESIIIYCLTIKETEKIAQMLKDEEIKCAYYHGKLDSSKRSKIHKKFIKGKCNCIVATNAFGMGINKENVRLVIHYGCPRNIESYYQEIGRAGRDLKASYCYLFYSAKDFEIQRYHIENSESKDPDYKKTQYKLLQTMKNYVTSNICRKKTILNYFEERKDTDCKKCDVCNSDRFIAKVSIEKEALLLLKLMTRLPRFGCTTYIEILRGSNSKKMKDYMKKLDFYGKGIAHSKDWWKELIDHLIRDDYISQVQLSPRMQIVVVGDIGQQVVLIDRTPGLDNYDTGIPEYQMRNLK